MFRDSLLPVVILNSANISLISYKLISDILKCHLSAKIKFLQTNDNVHGFI